MRRALMVLVLCGLAGAGWGQDYIRYTPTLSQVNAEYGAELAPAIAAANWTCGAGWDCSVAGTLNKNADGVGTAVPNPALTIVAGTTYKVVITVGAVTVASGATYTLGGTSGSAALTAAATYTHYVTAATTGNLIITPTPTATRFTITAVSVKALTDATGDLTVDGNLTVRSGSTFNAPILLADGVATAPSVAFASQPGLGLYRSAASRISMATGTSEATRFTGATIGLLSNSGQFQLGANLDVVLAWDAANTLALRNSTAAQTFNIYNTYTDGSNYERGFVRFGSNELQIGFEAAGSGTTTRNVRIQGNNVLYIQPFLYPATSDVNQIGAGAALWQSLFISRSIQGSKSKTLVDNTATAFVRLTVADDDYEGCAFGWTAYAEDADTDARQVRKGRTNVAILNNSGTEACNFSASADDQAILVTAGTFTCTFDCNSASADTVDLRATCDTSLNAAAETLTFEYRLDCESTIATLTPQ